MSGLDNIHDFIDGNLVYPTSYKSPTTVGEFILHFYATALKSQNKKRSVAISYVLDL